MTTWPTLPLRRVAVCWDHLRIPLNAVERADRQGSVPYWGANKVQDHVDSALVDADVVLLGEDGAPFFDRHRDVAFRVNEPIWPNNHIHVLKAHTDIDTRWLAYSLNDVDYSLYVVGSTRDKLTQAAMMSIELQVPSAVEQRAIADYLDRETAQIDAFIAKNEELIALLTERHAATVDGAMARHEQSRMRLKYRLSLNTGGVWGDDPTGEGDTVVLRSTEQTVDGRWRIESPALRALSHADARRFKLREGDLVVTKSSGSEAHIGKATLVDASVAALAPAYSNFMQRLVPSSEMNPKFLWYVLRSRAVRDQLNLMTTSTTGLGNLNGGILGNLLIPAPTLDEQSRTIGELDRASQSIEDAISSAKIAVGLARERRAALISAAVTGKIDVGVDA